MIRSLAIFFLLISLEIRAENLISAYGIYSNMSSDEGDVSGMEVYLLNDGRAGECDVSVLLQYAEGWPQYPELLDCCGCDNGRVVFTSKNMGKFNGLISDGHLIGEFIDIGKMVQLEKGQGFWQR